MKKYFQIALLGLFLLAIIMSCKKDEEENKNGDDGTPLVFTELIAESDTIMSGTSTGIKAIATGYKLSYNWSASAGSIAGSGEEINYYTLPCGPGTAEVTCTVKDGHNATETKTISIVLL